MLITIFTSIFDKIIEKIMQQHKYFLKITIFYFKTNLDSGEIIPQYMLLPKSQKLSKSLLTKANMGVVYS